MKSLIERINDFISVLGADMRDIFNKLDNISPMIIKYEEKTNKYIYYGGSIGNKKIINRYTINPFKKQQAIGEWNNRHILNYKDI